MTNTETTCTACHGLDRLAMGEESHWAAGLRGQDGRALCPRCDGTGEIDQPEEETTMLHSIDETDLDTYDTEILEAARQTPAVRAELTRRRAAQAARRRCDDCWHEGGQHARDCEQHPAFGERPVAGQMAAVEAVS